MNKFFAGMIRLIKSSFAPASPAGAPSCNDMQQTTQNIIKATITERYHNTQTPGDMMRNIVSFLFYKQQPTKPIANAAQLTAAPATNLTAKRTIMKTFINKYRVLTIAFVMVNLFLTGTAFGQFTSTSRADGNWSTNSTWSTTRTGTISTVGSSTTVTGVGTNFLTELSVGDVITTSADGLFGANSTILAISTNTSLTITTATTISSQAFKARRVPAATDNVILANTFDVTLVQNASCANLTINGTSVGTGEAAAIINSFTLNVSGNITISGGNFSEITMTSGTLNVGGNLGSGATFTAGTGSVVYTNTSGGQSVGAYTYSNLTFNNTSGTNTAGGAVTAGTFTTTAGGTLNMGTNALVVTTVSHAGTLRTQNTSATAISTGKTWVGRVQYDGAGQTVSAGTYNDLDLSGTGTKSATASSVVNGILTVNTPVTFSPASANVISGTGTLTGDGTILVTLNSATALTSQYTIATKTLTNLTVDFAVNAAQSIASSASVGTYGALRTSLGGTKTLLGAVTVNGDVTIGASTTLVGGSFTHTVGGDWTRTGTFTATGSTIDFNGAGAANIGTSNFQNLIFSGAGTKTATGALAIAGNVTISNNFTAGAFTHTVSGDWTNPGTFTATGSTIDFNGAAANIGAGNFQNVTFSGTGKTATGALTIAGNISISGTLTGGAFTHTVAGNWTKAGTFNASGTTIDFNGSTPGSIGASNFQNIIFSGGGAKTATGILAIAGNVTISNNFTAGVFAHTVGGDWIRTGAFTATAGSTIDFNGSGPGNIGASNFSNITFSGAGTKTATGILTIAGSVTVSNNFTAGAFTHTVGANWTRTGTFTATGSTIDFNGAGAGSIAASNFQNIIFSGAGIKTATGALTIAGDVTISNNFTAGALTHTVGGDWSRSGSFIATGSTIDFNGAAAANIGTSNFQNVSFSGAGTKTATGALTIAGNINLANNFTAGSFTHTVAGNFTGAGTFTAGTSTINYNGAAQTAFPGTYHNLTLSGTLVKTMTGVTVNGTLSIEGSSTASVAPTYGAAATLQYNTAANYNAGPEWITPFTATGGVIISNTGDITVGASKVLNAPLTINSSAVLIVSNTFLLTLNDNFIKAGTLTSGTGGVTISGSGTQNIATFSTTGPIIISGSGTQTIAAITASASVTFSGTGNPSVAGFTTTGTTSMTKTAGIATLTGNMNGVALTINGSGGTLNLGTGLSHTLSGTITLTAGTLNGGSSTIDMTNTVGSCWAGTGSLFVPGTGTVILSSGSDQALGAGATNFNNLTLSGSTTTKTFSTPATITGTLSIISSAVANLGSSNHNANVLSLGGSIQPSGSYGSTASAATYKSATWFGAAATGILNVTTGACVTGTWLGFTSTDWNNAGNWCGGIPTASTNVIIPSGTPNQPTINAGTTAVCNNITINSGATLTMANSATSLLNISGDFTRNGTFTPGTAGTVSFVGSASQTINNVTAFHNLTINKTTPSATVSSPTAFTATGAVTITQGNLILSSVSANYVVNGNLTATVNGKLSHHSWWKDPPLPTQFSLNVGGDFLIDGSYDYSAVPRAHLVMTGTGKNLRCATPLSIFTITGTVTAIGPITTSDNFWVNGSGASFTTNGQIVNANAALLLALGTVNLSGGGSLNVTGGLTLVGNINHTAGTLTTDALTIGDGSTTAANDGAYTQSAGTNAIIGSVTIHQQTTAVGGIITNSWNIGAGTATVSGLITFAGTSIIASRINTIIITSGTLNANGGITFSGTTPANKVITMSGGAGRINLRGALTGSANATLTAGTSGSIFDYADAAPQTINFFGAGAYHFLLIDNTDATTGASLSAAISITNVTGNISVGSVNPGSRFTTANNPIGINNSRSLTVASGSTMNAGTSLITFGTGGTATINGTFITTNSTGAILFGTTGIATINGSLQTANTTGFSGAATTAIRNTNTPTITLGAASTIDYNAGVAQSVTARTYANLALSGSGNKTIAAATTINNNLSISGTAKGLLTNATTTPAFSLTLGGINQVSGTWGSNGSAAINKTDTWFVAANTGIINVTSGCSTGTWLGTASTDWNTAANWCGGIPTATTDVIIPSGGNQPVIGVAAICRNITINSGASLTFSGAFTLTVKGNWNNGGTFTAGTGTILMNGTAAQTMIGSTFYDLVIDNAAGVTLNTSETVTNNLSITTSSFVNLGIFTHSAGSLTLGGAGTILGSWGHSTSPATYKNNTFFGAAVGIVNVANTSCVNPTISSSGTINALCENAAAQSATLVYSATGQNPISYSIDWDVLADQTTTAFAFAAGGGNLNTIVIPAATPAGTYTGTMTITNFGGCTNTQAVSITINSPALADDPIDVAACDSYILPALTNGNYFTGPGGTGTALFAGNTITSTQTLYVFAAGTSPCPDVENSFLITINTTPVADDPADVVNCGTYTLPALSAGNKYYTATGGGGTELLAGSLVTTSQTIYVYAAAIAPCIAGENSFEVTIVPPALADDPADVSNCGPYTLPVLTNGNYFSSPGGVGPVSAGTVISSNTTLYVFTAGVSPCPDVDNSFTITITTPAVADDPADVSNCGPYTLPALTNGNYFTGPGGTGTALFAGNTISSTQTLYVFAAGAGPCPDVDNSFVVTIVAPAVADDPADVTNCGPYTLPALTNGIYFSSPGGVGPLSAGDVISSSTTVYVFAAGTSPCPDVENSFDVTIVPPALADDPADVAACDSYILPALTNGNYFTGPGGTGTALFAGNTITSTQTIYVFAAGTSPCPDVDNSFLITINITPVADDPADVINCGAYTLPVLSAGNKYYTATGGGGTELLAGSLVSTSQTIYVYAAAIATCIPDENSFVVTIVPPALADDPADVTNCGPYTLPALTNGNYFSSPGGVGPVSTGTVISSNTTLYVFTAGTSPCPDVDNSFTITIITPALADDPADVTACDSYILPALTNGNYFTGPGGTGTALFAGNTITSIQTLYVFAAGVSPCPDIDNSFLITINETPLADDPADVTNCGPYTLPVLTNGNYFTGPGGTGTALFAGNTISSTQTLYVFAAGTAPCPDVENSFDITINPLTGTPVFIAGATAVCQNSPDETYTATAANSTGITYSVVPVVAGTINPTTGVMDWDGGFSGNVFITATATGLCGSTSEVRTVVVNPPPATPTITPGGPTTFCDGSSVSLNSSSATGNQWYKDGSLIVGATGQSYAATTTGFYRVVVTALGCSSAPSDIIGVTVNPIPATATISAGGPTTFCDGGSVILTSSSASGYQWYRNTVLIPGATSQNYPATISGSYTVVVTELGCPSLPSAATVVTVNATTVIDVQPVGGTICPAGNILLSVTASGTNLHYQWKKDGNNEGADQNTHNATATGTYTVVVTGDCGTATSIDAVVTITTYTITASSGANGTVTPAGITIVNCGDNQGYAITPDAGFHILDVLVDGLSVGAVGSYTFTNVTASHTISASFQADTHTITATAGANGNINPAGATIVVHGTDQSYTITADACYHIADVLVDGISVGVVSSYTFTNVTTDHTIDVSFAINTYTITASAGTGGTITPNGGVVVNCGANQSFTIAGDGCHTIADVLVDGVSVGAVSNYSFTNVTANHTIAVSFTLDTYTITTTAGANGSIDPGSVVNCGDNVTVNITPAACYHVATLVVDGLPVAPATSVTFTNVTANHTVDATFALNTYTITATAGTGGTITANGAVIVNCGDNQSFTIAANACYTIANVVVDGVPQGPITSYTFTNVTADHTIAASFTVDTYTITASAGTGGTITPNGGVVVNCGDDQSFTIAGDGCHTIADVLVDGVSVGAVSNYTFTNVTANHTIAASFTLNTYTITATSGANGSVTPAGISTVNCGTNKVYTITPNPGYVIGSVLVDAVNVGTPSSYTFTNVTANHTIHATFKQVITSDPAIVDVYMTDMSDVLINANQVPFNSVNKVKVPVQNFNLSTVIPAGTTKIRIDLGSKLQLNTGFDLSTAPLSAYFNWTKVVESGNDVIYGDQVADLPVFFGGNGDEIAIFDVKAVVQGTSIINADFQVTNHNNATLFLADANTLNNHAEIDYTVLSNFVISNLTSTNLACNAVNTGTIAVTVTGGAAPYDFSKDNGATWVLAQASPYTFTALAAGNYNIKVRDAASQEVTYGSNPVVITEPLAISLGSIGQTTISCNGGTATVTITASGGTAPLSYTFNGVTNGSGIFTGILAGTYSYSVTDANSCAPVAGNFTVVQPILLTITKTTHVNPSTGCDFTGSISVSAGGGTPNYQFRIDAGGYSTPAPVNATTYTFTGLVAGLHTMYVRDANGCEQQTTFTLTGPANTDMSLGSDNNDNIFPTTGTIRDIVYNVGEVGGKPGTPVKLRIFKVSGYNIIFNPSETNVTIGFNNYPVENANWTMVNSGGFVEFTRNAPLTCYDLQYISIRLQRVTLSKTRFNLNSAILPATSEIQFNNNSNSLLFIGN